MDTQATDTMDTLDTSDTNDTLDTSDTILPNLASVTTHNHHSLPDRWFNGSKVHMELIDNVG